MAAPAGRWSAASEKTVRVLAGAAQRGFSGSAQRVDLRRRSLELRALEDGLRLQEAVLLDLAVREAHLEVHGDEVAARCDLLEEIHDARELALVRRLGAVLRRAGLFVRGDGSLKVGLRQLLGADRSVDVLDELLVRRHRLLLLLLRLGDVLLDVLLDERHDRDDPRRLALRAAVPLALAPPRRGRRRRRLARCPAS